MEWLLPFDYRLHTGTFFCLRQRLRMHSIVVFVRLICLAKCESRAIIFQVIKCNNNEYKSNDNNENSSFVLKSHFNGKRFWRDKLCRGHVCLFISFHVNFCCIKYSYQTLHTHTLVYAHCQYNTSCNWTFR